MTDSESFYTTIVDGYTSVSDWLGAHAGVVVQIIIIIFISWLVVQFASKVLAGILKRTIRGDMYPTKTDRDKRVNTLNSISKAVIRFAVYAVAGFMILSAIGINTAPILASAGIIGIALGFGTQALVRDFISGLFIIIENQYRVGDYIEVQNVAGTVESITMRTTVLRDVDGSVHTIPNGSIGVTTNKTMGAGHTVLDLTVDASADLRIVEEVINSVGRKMADDPKLAKLITDPPHFMRISEFNDKGVTVKISSTTASGKQLEVKSAFLAHLQSALKGKDIKVISAVAAKRKSSFVTSLQNG